MKLLLVDDHKELRERIKRMLMENSSISAVYATSYTSKLLDKSRKKEYDVMILDISMSGMNGFEILQKVKDINPNLPVLIISVHSEEQYAAHALKLGAMGYLIKENLSEELIDAIQTVSAGGKFLSASLPKTLLRDSRKKRKKID